MTVFDCVLAAVQVQNKTLKLNRPIYVGQAILDLSKTFMYDFYYKALKPCCSNWAEVCYTDTDSRDPD